MQLAFPDIDANHFGGSTFKENVRKPAGRYPNVEANAIGRAESKGFQASRKLYPTARYPGMRRTCLEDGIVRNRRRCLLQGSAIRSDQARADCLPSLRPARKKLAFNEGDVGPLCELVLQSGIAPSLKL